jgi:hypothetical protein
MMPCVSYADDDAVKKYRNFTPEQLKALSEKELQSSVPMMYTMAANTALSKGADIIFASSLNRLMYPGINDYAQAVKQFQSDLGDKPTGIFTVYQIYQLQYRSELQSLSTISFPSLFSDIKDDTFAKVEGTLKIIDDKIAWPINHVRISCFKNEKYCNFEMIYLDVPDKDSWAQTFTVMEDLPETYYIDRWTIDSIDASLPETGDKCRVSSISLNFKTKEFFHLTKNGGGNCEFFGKKLEKLLKPRIQQVVDGEHIFSEEYSKIKKAAFDVLSSSFKKRVIGTAADQPTK